MKKRILDYNNPKILNSYALWYYARYYPSFGRLREKLIQKSTDTDLIDSIISELSSVFNEENLLETLVQNLLSRGKSKRYIIQKLSLKRFLKKDIDRVLGESDDHICGNSYLLQKITSSLRSKSLQKTRFNLISGGYDKDVIDVLISSNGLNDDMGLIMNLIKDMESKGLSKEKIIEKMISKGFAYRDIKEMLI